MTVLDSIDFFTDQTLIGGIHSCPGGPLAQVEARVTIERLLRRTSALQIDDARHGPADGRRFGYEPTYILRGLTGLHLTFDRAPERP